MALRNGPGFGPGEEERGPGGGPSVAGPGGGPVRGLPVGGPKKGLKRPPENPEKGGSGETAENGRFYIS